MRLADLVINSIKETLHTDDNQLTVANLRDGTLGKNPEYSVEVANVLLSINKAVSRLVTAGKIEYKHEILTGDPTKDIYSISSFKDVRKIRSVFIMKDGKPYWIGWTVIANDTILLGYGIDSTIHVVYERKIPNFTESDFNSEDDLDSKYGLTDELCNYITYFVKSELFEDIDPDRCKRYLNYFEQFINEVDTRQSIPYQSSVKAKFKY